MILAVQVTHGSYNAKHDSKEVLFSKKIPPIGSAFSIVEISQKNNPPETQVLLVPTQHTYEYEWLSQDLRKDIESGDILFIEYDHYLDAPELASPDVVPILNFLVKVCLDTEQLTSHQLVLNPYFMGGKLPWFLNKIETDEVSQLALHAIMMDDRAENLRTLHPRVFAKLMEYAVELVKKARGMDAASRNFFYHNQKPVLALDEKGLNTINEHKFPLSFYASVPPWNKALWSKLKIDLQHILQILYPIAMFSIQGKKMEPLTSMERKQLQRKDTRLDEYIERAPDTIHTHELAIQRNFVWVQKILQAMEENPGKRIVVLGGAYHFGGVSGILNLFRKNGYKITSD